MPILLALTAAAIAAFVVFRSRVGEGQSLVFDTPNPTYDDLMGPPTGSPLTVEPFTEVFARAARSIAGSARRLFALPASAAPYADAIRAAEQKHGIPQSLLGRVLWQESRFRPDIITGKVRSSAGAVGIAQFMPATAKDEGVNPLDPFDSINGAARYLRKLFNATGSWERALASYNWGIGNVTRRGLGAAPAETRAYVSEILRDVQV